MALELSEVPESPHCLLGQREEIQITSVSVGIQGHSLCASDVSVPSLERSGQLYGPNEIASISVSRAV